MSARAEASPSKPVAPKVRSGGEVVGRGEAHFEAGRLGGVSACAPRAESGPRAPTERESAADHHHLTPSPLPTLSLSSKTIQGVTEPPVQPIAPKPKFGFVENAEVTNSRAAMVRGALFFFLFSFFCCLFFPARPDHPLISLSLTHTRTKHKKQKKQQLGFFGILAVEALTGKGIFEMLGFKVGQGLGFEF